MKGVLFLEIIIVICVGLSDAQQQTEDPQPIERLCNATPCAQNSTCRVVQICAGSVCPPKAACLTCVPKGADDVCYKSGFAAAVLVGPASQPSTLIGRGCDPNQPGGEPNCPFGSLCIPDEQTGRGICCYGKPSPPNQSGTSVNNNNKNNNKTFCASECGDCLAEQVCRKMQFVCKKLPCLPRYDCVQRERKGSCPRTTNLGSSWCSRNKRVRCNTDFECFGSQKCCSDTCGGLRCRRPRN